MVSLKFSIDVNPEVFYILCGIYVVFEVIKLIYLFKFKNSFKGWQ